MSTYQKSGPKRLYQSRPSCKTELTYQPRVSCSLNYHVYLGYHVSLNPPINLVSRWTCQHTIPCQPTSPCQPPRPCQPTRLSQPVYLYFLVHVQRTRSRLVMKLFRCNVKWILYVSTYIYFGSKIIWKLHDQIKI